MEEVGEKGWIPVGEEGVVDIGHLDMGLAGHCLLMSPLVVDKVVPATDSSGTEVHTLGRCPLL